MIIDENEATCCRETRCLDRENRVPAHGWRALNKTAASNHARSAATVRTNWIRALKLRTNNNSNERSLRISVLF